VEGGGHQPSAVLSEQGQAEMSNNEKIIALQRRLDEFRRKTKEIRLVELCDEMQELLISVSKETREWNDTGC
jgi:hypothetical protein